MSYQSTGPVSEAVLFFNASRIVKEMLFSEFEAVLDGVVDMPDFADSECQAVFIQINSRLQVVSSVFFTISFDHLGCPDKSWNMPLRHMAEIAGQGPDMGAGAIRLACRSQCPVPWHQRHTWDPVMKPDGNSFVAIRNSVRENRLGLILDETALSASAHLNVPVLSAQPSASQASPAVELSPELVDKRSTDAQSLQFDREHRDKAAKLIKKLRFQISTQETRRRDDAVALHREYAKDITGLQSELEQVRHAYEFERSKNEQLKEGLAEQAAEFQLAREQFIDQVEDSRQLETEQIDALRKKFELELKAKLETETAELKEMLSMREVELYYREEQISQLRQQVSDLHQEKQLLLREGSGKFMEKLGNSGITFVAFHPGVGHITIALDDVGRYLDSPTAYAAEKSFVSEEQYLAWLNHYYNPICTASSEGGEPCLAALDRIERPGEFIAGRADRCQDHQNRSSVLADSQVVKIG
jgi:hypothetical protein